MQRLDYQKVQFDSPAGQLEGLLETPSNFAGIAAAAVCHPHPLYGGSMQNKVVVRMANAMQECGLATLRFNFRGIGRSSGAYSEGTGELEDALTALDYLQRQRPARKLLAGGFSFGAWIALQAAARRSDINQVVAAGTPVESFNFSFLQQVRAPVAFIQGELDSFGLPPALEQVRLLLPATSTLAIVKHADHFFTGRLALFQQLIRQALTPPAETENG